ncbi:family S53 protease-like protein [Mycena galopus ATCC 62051]|nr:family S53 protease-like protein [Mycena galopus ATCC 62051]
MAFHRILTLLWIIAAVGALHHERTTVPRGFVSQGVAPADKMLTLRIALAANDLSGLEAKATSLSSPGSRDFRQWLSQDEVKAYVQPSAETMSALNAFASANNLQPTVISPYGDWVSITLPVSQANELFGAQFEEFTHPALDNVITRTVSVSVPSDLVGHVDAVHPTTDFSLPAMNSGMTLVEPRHRRSTKRQEASCDTSDGNGAITPACLHALYGIPATPATQANNALAVTGYDQEWPLPSDLTNFLSEFRPDIPSNTTWSVVSVDGGVVNTTMVGSEANLDTQYTIGIATGVPVQFITVGGPEDDAGFAQELLDTATFLDGVADADLPTVVSTSYGQLEAVFGLSMTASEWHSVESRNCSFIIRKICNSHMALGARGVSILFASGDGGVHGEHDTAVADLCNYNVVGVNFPAACPWVTAVASTQGLAPETGANFSSGGFSNYFPIPAYQATAVNTYVQNSIPLTLNLTFNASGRGYPDVALQGFNFEIMYKGDLEPITGTSASTPLFASIIALVNDQLLAARKPVMGFLNPFIYANPDVFTDIISGYNSGYSGFNATAGWDPLTGMGSPIYSKLLAAALAQ